VRPDASARLRDLSRSAALWLAGLLVLVSGSPAHAGDPEDPRYWIQRMNHALANRNYDGVFIHQYGEHREMLRIIHRIKDGRRSERLVSIDGQGREFVRDGNQTTYYFPDRHLAVIFERRPPNVGFIGGLPSLDGDVPANYEVRTVDRGRLHSFLVRQIWVTPRDAFRYGYKLWIDETSAMPVKTQLVDASGNVLEQIIFASLTTPPLIDDELLKPSVNTTGFKWMKRSPSDVRPPDPLAWSTQTLPPGFHRAVEGVGSLPGLPRPASHLMFTDGVAIVSVFIENPERAQDGANARTAGPMGPAQLGAASAFTVMIDGHRVTAVGEVPPATVRAIAESLRPSDAAPLAGAADGKGPARPAVPLRDGRNALRP
jgi:sigma-E factor negative regulatory protein RseB